eukprot:5957691-Pleurochrysis_carterae.AAC.2
MHTCRVPPCYECRFSFVRSASPEEQEINQLIRAEMLVQAKATRNASPDTFERGDRIKEQAQRRAQREVCAPKKGLGRERFGENRLLGDPPFWGIR